MKTLNKLQANLSLWGGVPGSSCEPPFKQRPGCTGLSVCDVVYASSWAWPMLGVICLKVPAGVLGLKPLGAPLWHTPPMCPKVGVPSGRSLVGYRARAQLTPPCVVTVYACACVCTA